RASGPRRGHDCHRALHAADQHHQRVATAVVIRRHVAAEFPRADTSRAWAMASWPSRTFLSVLSARRDLVIQDCFGETPKPTRETRALPGEESFRAFTVIELLIVMAIIIVLAGLILATAGYVQKKGYRSRAES